MNITWLAITITVFAQGNSDGTPAVTSVPQRAYVNFENCDEWSKERYARHEGTGLDPVTGRVVSQFIFNCAPIDSIRVSDNLNNPD